MTDDEIFFRDLPDTASARRFLDELTARHSSSAVKLRKNDSLLLDVLTLASYSPLLAATILQHPDYIWWLNRKRVDSVVRNKDELLESLARFTLTNSQVDTHDLLSRFRRRELMRIFLRDIRRLVEIAEITEEISNLADAILEHALRVARQELDNRYGSPLETDAKGRQKPAELCIVSLGKLGSRELNYSSDIDLLFLYSGEGSTSGIGSRGSISNREYFIKLAVAVVRIVGSQSGEGSAYRVDLRLRPHGKIGPLAMSVADTVSYYENEARPWERQVLIRSRCSSGAEWLFRSFFQQVEATVFPPEESVEEALRNVRESKQKIDIKQINTNGIDVKLGTGGIREIEFIAQALQLAHGGNDVWLRSPHTLISLSRLSDRHLISEQEHTTLSNAYTFLRQLEHVLQMENGLQTHLIPNDKDRRGLVARKMRYVSLHHFDETVSSTMAGVHWVFRRVFDHAEITFTSETNEESFGVGIAPDQNVIQEAPRMREPESRNEERTIREFAARSVRFAELVSARPNLGAEIATLESEFPERDYEARLNRAVQGHHDFSHEIAALRREWARSIIEVITFDLGGKLTLKEAKRLQTKLAEASIEAALSVTRNELGRRFHINSEQLDLAILGLGKLGGAGVDYDSDLDLVIVFVDKRSRPQAGMTPLEFYSKAAEIFTNTLSAITRDGSLYRVDLRLRPYGKDGSSVISVESFEDYVRNTAVFWEMLAFVKLRGVGGDLVLARSVEDSIRRIIHERAAAVDPAELATETRKIRKSLEKEKTELRRSRDIDIKFGAGGMLDIYFAIRFLQLRDNVPDTPDCRSTDDTLEKLHAAGSISRENFELLSAGYQFLSKMDHSIRLTIGRSTRLPMANKTQLVSVAELVNCVSVDEMLTELSVHRFNIRSAFDSIVR